jgi:hypothetical protein
MNDREAIIKLAIEGQSLKAIGRKFDCTIPEVCLILDEFAATALKPAARARRLAFEAERLDHLQTVFAEHAIVRKTLRRRRR